MIFFQCILISHLVHSKRSLNFLSKNLVFGAKTRLKLSIFKRDVSRCMKISEKVSFNIMSEADKKWIKNAKNSHFGEFFKTESCQIGQF